VGKLDTTEVEAAATRVAQGLRRPVELRGTMSVPPGVEDRERGQYRAATLMSRLRAAVPQLGPGKLLGAADPAARPPARPDGVLFVTDVDLFTAKTDGVFAALSRPEQSGVVSLRRLREAFYRRPAEPLRLKELLRVAARLQGLSECREPRCALAPSRVVADVDSKDEGFCRACSQRLFQGTIKI
jgi:predicted Zn-dependent protease